MTVETRKIIETNLHFDEGEAQTLNRCINLCYDLANHDETTEGTLWIDFTDNYYYSHDSVTITNFKDLLELIDNLHSFGSQ